MHVKPGLNNMVNVVNHFVNYLSSQQQADFLKGVRIIYTKINDHSLLNQSNVSFETPSADFYN